MAEKKSAAKEAMKPAKARQTDETHFDDSVCVVIQRRIRSALGAYEAGQKVFLPGGIARAFIKDGRAVRAH